MLEARFLGTVQILVDGKDIAHKFSHKSLAILALLFVHEGRSTSREKLMGLLWPESSEDAAKYNLRYNLWNINKLIPSDADGEGFLIITKEICQINPSYACFCDVDRIREDFLDDLSQRQLEEKLSLLSGEYFENIYFPGCDRLLEYIIMERHYLENRKLDILKRVIDGYNEKERKSGKFLELLQLYEKLDPYDESVAGKRISFLIEDGKYKEALKYFHFFNTRLMQELGVRPSEELKRIIASAKGLEEQHRGELLLTIQATSMESLEGFCLGEILHGLHKKGAFAFRDYLTDHEVQELAYLQVRLGEPAPQANLLRSVEVFIHLMGLLAENGYRLTICVDARLGMDSLSRDVLRLLEGRLQGAFCVEA